MSDRRAANRFTALFATVAHDTRTAGTGALTWRSWAGLLIVPTLIVGILAWAFWDPTDNHAPAQAAVVNNDDPVKVQGQLAPIGRELAAEIVDNEDSSFDWTITNGTDANKGLRNGEYAAVVTIPKTFSKAATSAAEVTMDGDPGTAQRATVDVRISDHSKIADPMISNEIARDTLETLNDQLVETYLNNIYIGFNSMHEMIVKASDNADELASGSDELAASTDELVNGTHQLATAAAKLDNGATELSSGTDSLAAGSAELSNGLHEMAEQTSQLPAQTRQLAEGARQVADGNRKLADTIAPLAEKVITLIDALPSTDEAARRFDEVAQRCSSSGANPEFCAMVQKAADQFDSRTGRYENRKQQIRDAAVQARNAVNRLAKGSERVARGNEKLAEQIPELTGGIAQSASGAGKLHAGIQELSNGAAELADGTGKLAAKTPELAAGAEQFQRGAEKLDTGAEKFADKLDDGKKQVPTYSDQERDHLKQVAASPATTSSHDVPDFGPYAIALIVVVALWALALATYILTSATPSRILTSRAPTWKLALRTSLPGAAIATLTAVITSGALIPLLSLTVAEWFALLGVTVLAANAFMTLNHAAIMLFGRSGRFVSLAVLVLTVATGVVSTIPGALDGIGELLPTAGGVQALRAVTTGADGLVSGVLQLTVWLALGSIATLLMTERSRTIPMRQLRLGQAV